MPREFRGVWVATVANIDWPSRPGLASEAAQAEVEARLDAIAAIGLNAVVLQVRPAADLLYPSALEPWSEVLSGTAGLGPDPAWDPLAAWLAGARRRGLELHAWLNPYRARHPSARSEAAAGHVSKLDPAIVKRYGDQLWLDPGEPRAAARMRAVVAELLARCDLDGVHIDDYFYPYPAADGRGGDLPFPDDDSYARHGGGAERAAWRRANVDALVESLHREVHAARPWVRLGISPFGLPRPDRRPPGIEGFSQYDRLHADVERWLEAPWLDYLAPQLYWPIAQPAQAFGVLQRAWREANVRQRHLWPGLFTSRLIAERNRYDADEVLAQVALTREGAGADPGHLHFSLRALLADADGVATRLRQGPYAEPALTPATPWLAEPRPAPPLAAWSRSADRRDQLWPLQGGGAPLRHAVLWQARHGRWHWQSRPMPADRPFEPEPGLAAWLVGVGRSGRESEALPVDAWPAAQHSAGL